MGKDKEWIAGVLQVSVRTVQRYTRRLLMFGEMGGSKPVRSGGRPSKITTADGDALLEYMLDVGWLYHDEIVVWLNIERNVTVSVGSTKRLFKKRGWSRAVIRRTAFARSEELREAWRNDMRNYVAEDLIFLDESIFNEKTGWRYRAYGPIGSERRYPADIGRGATWSILAAVTTEGYLPCTGIRLGYWSTLDLLTWLRMSLLPALEVNAPGKRRVIALDNCSTHVAPEVLDTITSAGHEIKYLPPYSPDYNPIELTFSVLKSWMRRNYSYTRHIYTNFGDYLQYAITRSRCDRFARQHFRHAANGLYLEQCERDRFLEWVQRGTEEQLN